MNGNVRYRKKPRCNVTVEFAPRNPDAQYTDDKKRVVLKIIFEGFEKRKVEMNTEKKRKVDS